MYHVICTTRQEFRRLVAGELGLIHTNPHPPSSLAAYLTLWWGVVKDIPPQPLIWSSGGSRPPRSRLRDVTCSPPSHSPKLLRGVCTAAIMLLYLSLRDGKYSGLYCISLYSPYRQSCQHDFHYHTTLSGICIDWLCEHRSASSVSVLCPSHSQDIYAE